MAKQTLNIIKNWFKTGLKPTQAQFWDTWDSFWHKDEIIPTISIENLDNRFNQKADQEAFQAHILDPDAHGIDKKVDKENGKGLSTNDFTTYEKEKLETLYNYDDEDITERIIEVENNKADLIDGLVPAHQLPSYVDDVLEFGTMLEFPENGEGGKVYIAQDTNKTYRWSGSAYVIIGADLALGETAQTAYRGDRGKIAYDYAIAHNNVDNTSDANKPLSTLQEAAINTKLTGALATDAETQIAATITEDNKIVSRLKLFNWWTWIKNNTIMLGNNLTLFTGTATTAPLIIPSGTLTTVPQNGAIERDASGILWNTFNDVRNELTPTRFSRNIGGFKINSANIFIIPINSALNFSVSADTAQGGGNIYPASFDTAVKMLIGDSLVTSLLMGASSISVDNSDFFLRFKIFGTDTFNGMPILRHTYDIAWNIITNSYWDLKLTYLVINKGISYGALIGFYIVLNGVYNKAFSFYSFNSADVRLELVKNNSSVDSATMIAQINPNTLFIPI